MTVCADRLEAILVATPEELSGDPTTELGRHVAACGECAEAARRILAGQSGLSDALASAPSIDASAVLARARMTAIDGGAPASTGRRRWRRVTVTAGGLAAAAVAALLLLPSPPPPLPGTPWANPVPAAALVEPQEGQRVAVFETRNPDIKLVWIF